jgi:hypothetical protein
LAYRLSIASFNLKKNIPPCGKFNWFSGSTTEVLKQEKIRIFQFSKKSNEPI